MLFTNTKDTIITAKKYEDEKLKVRSNLKFIVIVLVVSFISVHIITYFGGITQISGNSMYPTYKNGELHIYSTDISNITYGDVVIFKNSQQTNNCIYIKRVVALSGDEFSCDGTVYSLNGKVLVEKYINSNISKPYNFDYIVPDNYIYVCGDNRDESYDSREFGAINKNDVIGIIEY